MDAGRAYQIIKIATDELRAKPQPSQEDEVAWMELLGLTLAQLEDAADEAGYERGLDNGASW